MVLSNCVVCASKKSKFINEQEGSGLLSRLGINIPFINKILNGVNKWTNINKFYWRSCV